ncbi:MAG: sugar ABC transporter permease [Firmicutes bacterium]|nr:sugar ABC transporter permease [Bacillota bacterium]
MGENTVIAAGEQRSLRVSGMHVSVHGRERRFFTSLILPALVIMAFTIGFPLASGVRLGFFRYFLTDITGENRFIGLGNFANLLRDRAFYVSFYRTVEYAAGVVVLSFIIGFALALLLNQDIHMRGVFRSLFLVPWIVPYVVVSLLFMWILNANYGVFNVILSNIGLIKHFRGWLIEPRLAMPSVILATAWKTYPFFMLMLLAGLQTVPAEQYEAATIDGAGVIQRFLYVTWPNLREIIMIVTLLEFIWEFQNFTLIWVLTKGGPIDATNIWPVHIYKTAFKEFNMGYGSAMGVLWLVFLLIFSLGYIRVVGGKEAE